MHIFSRHCFCKKQSIPFRSVEPYDEHSLANVFCPICSDRAPEDALIVEVIGVPKWSGMYAVDWNKPLLQEKDSDFKDLEKYYSKIFSSGSLCFGFLPSKESIVRSLRVNGLKQPLPVQRNILKKVGAEDMVLPASRKRIDRGTREAKKRKKY